VLRVTAKLAAFDRNDIRFPFKVLKMQHLPPGMRDPEVGPPPRPTMYFRELLRHPRMRHDSPDAAAAILTRGQVESTEGLLLGSSGRLEEKTLLRRDVC